MVEEQDKSSGSGREENWRRLLTALEEQDGTAFRRLYREQQASDYVNERGQTWLHLVLEYGLLDSILDVLSSTAKINARDTHGRTPLMIAAVKGYDSAIEQLLAKGASVSAKSSDGTTALTLAIRNRHVSVCRLLIAADPNEATQKLFYAIARDVCDDVALLLEAGVSPDTVLRDGKLEKIALHAAVFHPSILRTLLQYGASVNVKDATGTTALSIAAAAGDLVACDILLNKGASIHSKDNRGCSPMYHACCRGKENIISRFLQLGADINSASNMQRTALFYHAERGNVEGCELLLRYHADINHKDMSKCTALHFAASLGHKEVCRLLLEHFTEPLETDDAQMILCKSNSSAQSWISVTRAGLMRIYAEVILVGVKATLSKYGTLMIRDCAMNTLLHIAAAETGDMQIHYLIRSFHLIGNISINIQNCFNETPLDIAMAKDRSLAIIILQSLGAKEVAGEKESFHTGMTHTFTGKGAPYFLPHASSSSGEFSMCTRHRLAQLCRGIEDGIYSCTDDIASQLDSECGNTVLHYFLYDCSQRSVFPSVQEQKDMLNSDKWLGNTASNRLLWTLVTKRNWEGKTPLHVAAEIGALGFCQALIEKGADASEECSASDKRLIDQPTENFQFWKPINFAATISATASSTEDDSAARLEQRNAVVVFLLGEPEALPSDEQALLDCREKIQRHFPLLLPRFLRIEDSTRHITAYAKARALYEQFLEQCYNDQFGRSYPVYQHDSSGVAIHKIFLDTRQHGVRILKNYAVEQYTIETTGDSLLHLVAAHGHRNFAALISYLLTEAQMDINQPNKQLKTALHIACEQNQPDICAFLIARGADVTMACQNVKSTSVGPWLTPLYTALWNTSPTPYGIIEILLSTPNSVILPRHPKLRRTDISPSTLPTPDMKWNDAVLQRLLDVHPSALALFLDHYAVEMNHVNGDKVYRFNEVFEVCQNLEQIVSPPARRTSRLAAFRSFQPPSVVTHPVIRNAIRLKWKLFGAHSHKRQVTRYVLMLTFFFLSNLFLPNIKVKTLPNGDLEQTSHYKWIDFQKPLDYFVGATKFSSWGMALYLLVYVEFYLEWRSDRSQYWRSLWNLLDIGTYLLVLSTIPFEIMEGHDTIRECLLSILSILLCVNLMQTLMVSSFFSVLIFTFVRMCRVVAQFLFHYLLLLLGFSGAFYLLFHGLGPHTGILTSMRIVFLATFGDIDYDDNFHIDQNIRARNWLGFTLLVLYVAMVVVVALNLVTALMTSEYEKVRAQAEERSLTELANALHRYEKWIGRDVVKTLYTSLRGTELLQSCVRKASTTKMKRRGGLPLVRSSKSRLATYRDTDNDSDDDEQYMTHLNGRVTDGMYPSLPDLKPYLTATMVPNGTETGTNLGPATHHQQDSMRQLAAAITSDVMKRVNEEVTNLRMQLTTQLQDQLEGLKPGSHQSCNDIVAKVDLLLQRIPAPAT